MEVRASSEALRHRRFGKTRRATTEVQASLEVIHRQCVHLHHRVITVAQALSLGFRPRLVHRGTLDHAESPKLFFSKSKLCENGRLGFPRRPDSLLLFVDIHEKIMAMNAFLLFPQLSGNEQVAALILRFILGLTLAYFAFNKIQKRGQSSGSNSVIYGVVEFVVALMLVAGLFTQIAALINAVILLIKLSFKASENKLLSDGVNYYLLLLAIAAALIFIGSGLWSVDYLLGAKV